MAKQQKLKLKFTKKKVDKWLNRIGKIQCPHCGTPLIPDLSAIKFNPKKRIKEWDGSTYKFNCDCMSKFLRISILK